MKYILILILIPLSAQAQSIHLSAGAALPTGHLGDYWNTGYGVEGAGSYSLGLVEPGIFISYSVFGMDANMLLSESGLGRMATISGGEASAFTIMTGFILHAPVMGGSVRPYLRTAGGLYRVKTERVDIGMLGYHEMVPSVSSTRIGWQLGLGLAYAVTGSTSATVEARYVTGMERGYGKRMTHVPVSLGISQKLNLYTRN